MNIIESDKYKKSYKKLIKNNKEEVDRIENIKMFLISKKTLHDVMMDPWHNIYHIHELKETRHEYSAKISNSNNKLRLIMKPVGNYPYNTIEITDIEFYDLDNYHYKRG